MNVETMTVGKQDVSSTRKINKGTGPRTKAKTREITVDEAKKSARKTIRRYKTALKELARR